MPRAATPTRERILDVATDMALDRGFAAASLDEVLAGSGVTKGAFYHYFASKADLGRAILDRYATADLETLDRLWTQAEQLSRDPLQQLLVFVGLFANLDELATDDPGCLYATFIYERQLGVDGAGEIIEASVRAWRDRFRAKLDEVVERYPPTDRRRPRRAVGPHVHHLRGRLHRRPRDARSGPRSRSAAAGARLPRAAVRAGYLNGPRRQAKIRVASTVLQTSPGSAGGAWPASSACTQRALLPANRDANTSG